MPAAGRCIHKPAQSSIKRLSAPQRSISQPNRVCIGYGDLTVPGCISAEEIRTARSNAKNKNKTADTNKGNQGENNGQ
jgi:hypothetical protein